MSYADTFAFIDNARRLERESVALGDMKTAAILAGIADSEEHYLQEDIAKEWAGIAGGNDLYAALTDLLRGNPWDVPEADYGWGL